MKYRISFYRKAEVTNGRAPRYMVDVEADSVEAAKQTLKEGEVLRSIYKSPDKPIRTSPSFVFLSAAARTEWYKNHKATSQHKERVCKTCSSPVGRYQRVCADCKTKETTRTKKCATCGVDVATRVRYCAPCLSTREKEQEVSRRKQRRRKLSISRLESQLKTATEMLAKTPHEACLNSSFYQGLRFPQCMQGAGCRTCLQQWIDTQTVHFNQLKEGKLETLKSSHPGQRVRNTDSLAANA